MIQGLSTSCRLRNFIGLGLIATGCLFVVEAMGDVRGTQHNLISSRDRNVSEKDVCTFCHTPVVEFGENPSVKSSLKHPLWQKSVDAEHVYTIYDDIGRRGLGKPSVGSQSIACLSCHDSNQAFSTGKTDANHPFGVPYRGASKGLGALGLSRSPGQTGAAPYKAAEHLTALTDFRDASRGTVEGRIIWWVSKDGITARRTRRDLPLYGRIENGGETGPGQSAGPVPYIECSSCHDPHSENQSFLRVANEGSMLCLTCHEK